MEKIQDSLRRTLGLDEDDGIVYPEDEKEPDDDDEDEEKEEPLGGEIHAKVGVFWFRVGYRKYRTARGRMIKRVVKRTYIFSKESMKLDDLSSKCPPKGYIYIIWFFNNTVYP